MKIKMRYSYEEYKTKAVNALRKTVNYCRKHPYSVVNIGVLLFFLATLFLGGDSLFVEHRYQHRIDELEEQLKLAQEKYRTDSIQLSWTLVDKIELEHVARARFNFKKPEEVIFLIEDSAHIAPSQSIDK